MATFTAQSYSVRRTLQKRATQVAQVAGVVTAGDIDPGGTLARIDCVIVPGTDFTTVNETTGYVSRRFTLLSGDEFDTHAPSADAKLAVTANFFTPVFELGCTTVDRVLAAQVQTPAPPVAGAALLLLSNMGVLLASPPSVLVDTWVDESGNGHTELQAVDANRLAYTAGIVNGQTAAGTAEARYMGAPSVVAAGDWTMFVVLDRNPNVSVQDAYYAVGFNAGATGLFSQGAVVANWGITDGVTPLLAGEVLPAGRSLLTITKSGLNYTLRRGGVTKVTAARLATFLSAVKVNARGNLTAAFFGGHGYPAILVYPSALSATDRDAVEAYLTAQWSVP